MTDPAAELLAAAKAPYKIRERELRGYVREAGGYDSWTEFQVVLGRKIISRHDFYIQAQKAIKALHVSAYEASQKEQGK